MEALESCVMNAALRDFVCDFLTGMAAQIGRKTDETLPLV